MKGNLTIDNGNTSVKVALYMGTRLLASNRFARRDPRMLDRFISTYKPDTAILCSTAAADSTQRMLQVAQRRCRHVINLTHETPLPITIDYRTPASLGRDRIATAVGAWAFSQRVNSDNDILVIDAGTAITYDLVTASRHLVGGNIAPGLALRFKSLHEHTGALPLVEPDGDLPIVGYDTASAIRSGVMRGLLHEIQGYINSVRLSHPCLQVMLTGGDAKRLHALLADSSIIVHEHLAADGLNYIFLYNQQQGQQG